MFAINGVINENRRNRERMTSCDDSTISRYDNLLAEIMFRLERITIRFIGEESSDRNRILAMDWRQVICCVQLSPRDNRTEISLSVGDVSIQRLRIGPRVTFQNDAPNHTDGDTFVLTSKDDEKSSER